MNLLNRAWVGMKGAARYARAIAAGDVASAADAARRVGGCAACTAVTLERGVMSGRVIAFCGPALVERLGSDVLAQDRTCGCLVGFVPAEAVKAGAGPIELRGLLVPAGKTEVASEVCPRWEWGQVRRHEGGCCGAGGCGGHGPARATGTETGAPDGGLCKAAAHGP